MELTQDIYRAFEDVVGTENISADPAVVDGYCFQPFGAVTTQRFFTRAAAILLPGNTKEVQAIVKLCARFGMKCKALGTGYGIYCLAGSEDTVTLDLRRMNRIIDIDKKNMIAIIEPYVTFGQVMAEAMKLGLACNVLGAGCQASMLASYTSMVGNNTQSVSQGYSARNLLGVEWVLPTGEIVRLGAPGSGAGWFSGDGPGPSLRGIMRGSVGAMGGLGVFTKCAAHLHPWFGPPELEIKGISPYYEAELPPNFEYHVLEWPTWEQCADALYKIGESEIAFAFHKTAGPGSHGSIVTGCNNEYYEKRQAGKYLVPEVSWAIVTAGYTPEEHAYQVKVLDKILEETGGKISPIGEDPDWKNVDFINMIKACFIPRMSFRIAGTFSCDGMMGQESIDNCMQALKTDRTLKDKYSQKGVIMDDGTCTNWGVIYEGGHFALLEGGYSFSSIDENNMKEFNKMVQEGSEIALKKPLGLGWMAMDTQGPIFSNFSDWKRKIKRSFDPNTVVDPTTYVSLDE